MKSVPTYGNDAEDDIFGPPRSYSTGYCSTPRQRPSMISAKYRQKEERRKVLKISVNKLRKIEDPEASLCRSVLINNTMKRLQKEAKDEKCAGQQQQQHHEQPVVKQPILVNNVVTDFAIDTDDLVPTELTYGSRKRPAEPEVEDCDVQDVLSQFYMPPTPRMLTSIDDDDDETTLTEAKRPRFDDRTLSSSSDDQLQQQQQQQLRQNSLSTPPPTAPVTTASSFSCGHASMFGELQSNVFHSLVASLET